jgi:hypothetical protein
LRTLVVSDLHLGARSERDLLRRAEILEALTAALSGVDRLVLLGDLLELRQSPARDALAAAQPVLRVLGEALDAGTRVTIVPGNHDHRLVVPWQERAGRDGAAPALGLETAVDWRAGEVLARIVSTLAPRGTSTQVDAAYPGCWLRDDVYAMHGHYSDRHATVPMLERLGAGAMVRIAGERPAGPRSAEDYEAVLSPMYAWMDALAQTGGPAVRGSSAAAWRALAGDRDRRGLRGTLRRRALVAAFPALVAGLNRAGLGPVSADLSTDALRRSRLRAGGEVVLRLGVEARHVVFGHSHRAGPLAADMPADWRAVTGTTLTNTGCWVEETTFLGPEPSISPYRPGFAVFVQDNGPPVLVNLLDGSRAPARRAPV